MKYAKNEQNLIYRRKYFQTGFAFGCIQLCRCPASWNGYGLYMAHFVLIECLRQMQFYSVLEWEISCANVFNILVLRWTTMEAQTRAFGLRDPKMSLASLLRFKVLSFHSKYIMRHHVVAVFYSWKWELANRDKKKMRMLTRRHSIYIILLENCILCIY